MGAKRTVMEMFLVMAFSNADVSVLLRRDKLNRARHGRKENRNGDVSRDGVFNHRR